MSKPFIYVIHYNMKCGLFQHRKTKISPHCELLSNAGVFYMLHIFFQKTNYVANCFDIFDLLVGNFGVELIF